MVRNDPFTTAQIIADTRAKSGVRITTMKVTFPRIILAEVNTHRVLSKSAASSRAIPVAKRIAAMDAGMVYKPDFDGAVANKPGMQSTDKLPDDMIGPAKMIWDNAIDEALEHARQLAATGSHKQFVNRLLEPFMYQTSLLTATEWDNFYLLRNHPDAQPEFQDLAIKMRAAYEASTPRPAPVIDGMEVHLPYYDTVVDGAIESLPMSFSHSLEKAFLVSSARCARVSYFSFETGKRSSWDEDERLAADLIGKGHMSPFDHAAVADDLIEKFDGMFWSNPDGHKQFFGWIPYRTNVEIQLNRPGRRNSYGLIKKEELR